VISRSYDIPMFVDEHSLVIASSYSGNTEETLEAMDKATQRGACLAVIAHGGKLKERAEAGQLPFAEIPECVQPRAAAFYGLRAMVQILEACGLVQGALDELAAVGKQFAELPGQWSAKVPTAQNGAKQLAEELAGKTPIIYAGILYGAAYKWKIGFNENAKNLAWCDQLPEFNHNEFIGWSSHPIDKPFAIINLLSTFDHPRVQKRFIVSEKLLSGMRPESVDVQAKGDSLLEQIIWVVLYGDFVSTYVALLNGVNPSPVDLVEKFKKELN
jgi:glucose/mannose-6-phosphate isomerase